MRKVNAHKKRDCPATLGPGGGKKKKRGRWEGGGKGVFFKAHAENQTSPKGPARGGSALGEKEKGSFEGKGQ